MAKQKNSEAGKVVKTEFDPKNREVTLLKLSKGYKVIKPVIGFSSELLAEKKAEDVFAFQKGNSQNQ